HSRSAEIKRHGLPPFRFAVLGVNMVANLGIADHLADVLAVFDDRVARLQRLKRDLVPNGNVRFCGEAEIRIVGGDDTQHFSAGGQILDDDDADIVLMIVDKKLWNAQWPLPYADD
ncbi:hypothetical protein, partial [Paracoccus sp. (in: a-proteobacteria)]|uniref:hypothetical protein n=1 Tax=Paracoccus sp. TaxID=267 RepID=UPI00396C49E4